MDMDEKKLLTGASEHFEILGRLPGEKKSRPIRSGTEFGQSEQIKIKPKIKSCPDCGDLVEGRTVVYVLKRGYKDRHVAWEKKCGLCKRKETISTPYNPAKNK